MTEVKRGVPARQGDSSNLNTTEKLATPAIDRWNPASQLSTPAPRNGWRYRWIREIVNGERDTRNVAMSKHEGYEFVRISEAEGDLGLIVDNDEKGDGLARYGGLVLARIPEEFCRQREAYYAKKRQESVASANRLQGIGPGPRLPESYEDRGSGARDVGLGAQRAMQEENW